MKKARKLYELFLLASCAHAKWDIEVSTNILKSRKKLLILLALASPVLLVSLAGASDHLP